MLEITKIKKAQIFTLCIGSILFSAGIFLVIPFQIKLLIFAGSYLIIGGSTILKGLKSLSKTQLLDDNFLITIATLGAFGLQEYSDAIITMFIFNIFQALKATVKIEFPSSKETQTEYFIHKFAKYYKICIVITALFPAILVPILNESMDFSKWIYRSFILLILSCTHTMTLSVQLCFTSAVNYANTKGIMIKYSNYVEELNRVNVVVFDLILSEELIDDAAYTVSQIREFGDIRVAMLSGDSTPSTKNIARKIKIDEFYAELLPQQKTERLQMIKQSTYNPNLVFIGNTISDTSILNISDIGVSLGSLCSDSAKDASGVVLVSNEPSKLIQALKIARKTRNPIWKNITLTVMIKIILISLGISGNVAVWEAILADTTISIITVLNSYRAMK